MSSSSTTGPHGIILCDTARERFIAQLLDRLWARYRQRVSYVQKYEQVIQQAGARFVNDHIAFRTIASSQQRLGITTLSRVFEALGYRPAGVYVFQDKHLNAIHYQHVNRQFPKLFISELKVWELPTPIQEAIVQTVMSHRPPFDDGILARLHGLDDAPDIDADGLLNEVVGIFDELPWQLPDRDTVIAANQVSQYAAWVLVHGYNVNHFTSLINSHEVEQLRDIELTVQALCDAGVPMKADIEGQKGSKLRQSATQAVTIDVDAAENGQPVSMPWTYAYFELAERGEVRDTESGESVRFEGFLGPQATNLFDMTTVRES